MKRQFVYLLLLLALLFLPTGCVSRLFGLNLYVIGERSSLERQVLGTYQEIGRDLSAYASVRGVNPDGTLKTPPKSTDSQARVLEAMGNRRYNRDDLDLLLTNGIVGEGADGMLAVLAEIPELLDQMTAPLITQLIAEENRDRGIIIDRLVRTTPGVTEENRGEVAWVFATLNHDQAPASSRIQAKTGEWKTK